MKKACHFGRKPAGLMWLEVRTRVRFGCVKNRTDFSVEPSKAHVHRRAGRSGFAFGVENPHWLYVLVFLVVAHLVDPGGELCAIFILDG